MEMALTARQVSAAEAKQMGLITEVLATKTELVDRAKALAKDIARKSPIALSGIKQVMQHSRCA